MTGKKNVSDYLTDRKFSLFEKENQYVVCSDEKIIWLVGERSDNRFRITNTTKRVMIIRLQKSDKHLSATQYSQTSCLSADYIKNRLHHRNFHVIRIRKFHLNTMI